MKREREWVREGEREGERESERREGRGVETEKERSLVLPDMTVLHGNMFFFLRKCRNGSEVFAPKDTASLSTTTITTTATARTT